MAEIQKKQSTEIDKFLKARTGRAPLDIPAQITQDLTDPVKRLAVHRRLLTTGSTFNQQRLAKLLQEALATSYYRRTFYRETENCASHPLVAGALELYVDACCGLSPTNNRITWATAEGDMKVENTLNQMLEELYVDERIRDWAGQEVMFGDFFVEAIGREGIGVAYLDDNIHPADIERIDINGRLEGFVRTGLYTERSQYTADLEAPWKYVHFRIFGITRKVLNTALGIFGEPGKMFSLERERMGERKFRITTKYGTSLLVPAIPVYKRLKLAEDSIMLSRITRGVLWYLYKIKISGGNMDQAAEIVNEYAEYLKRYISQGLDTTEGQQLWRDKFQPILGQVEDVFVPESDDISLSMEKMGGEPDIKAIVDIDMLTNQLLGALRVSKSMLGITDDLPSSIGEGAANRISINFAKNAQRVQTGLRQGLKRLGQIHLAYRNMNPDPTRFEINFAEISSAEEEELKNALNSGVDVVDKLMAIFKEHVPNLDSLDMLNYLNDKVLKLNDLDFDAMKQTVAAKGIAGLGVIGDSAKDNNIKQKVYEFKKKLKSRPKLESDCMSHLPDVTAEKNKLDESLKVLVTTPDADLSEEQRHLKHKVMNTKKTMVFRMDEKENGDKGKDLKVVRENANWASCKVKFGEDEAKAGQ